MKLNKTFLGLALAASSLSIYACDSKDDLDIASDEPIDETFAVQTEKMLINVDTLYSDLESPWGMTWLPDGKMLLTERKGEILIFENDKFTGQKVQGLPKVHEVNQAGLLDVQAHPNYAQNGWIYISYAKPKGGNKGATTIMRF